MQKRVVAPLRLALLLSWSAMVRHTATQRKADLEEELDEGSRITWVGAAVNFVLAFLKLFAGVTGRSAAMIADAGHSFSDLISDGVTLLALRMSTLPADIDHPYGHGRFESVASLAIGALLLGAGASFGAGSLAALAAPTPRPPMLIALWAAVASIGSKEALYRATRRVGTRLRSQVLMANAWHHRSDALSSVVALAGIGGSLLGLPALDPLAGLGVAGLIGWMGLRISIEALAQLTDTSDYGVVQAAGLVARRVPGVETVSHIRSRSMGGSALVDLAIQVDPMLSASCAHHLAEEVRRSVMEEASRIADSPISEVLVHVDTAPHDYDCPLQTSVEAAAPDHAAVEADVRSRLLALPGVESVPRVHVFYLGAGVAVEARVGAADSSETVDGLRAAAARWRQRLLSSLPYLCQVSIGVDLADEGAAEKAGAAEGANAGAALS